MHAALSAWAIIGCEEPGNGSGGENLSGGVIANGTPRNLFVVAVAYGTEVVVPTTGPEDNVTVGML